MPFPAEYKSSFHPKDLINRMTSGELNTQVFAAWKISKKTFYKWLNEHEDLQEAYEIGDPACEAWWIAEMKKKWQEGDEKGFKYCALIVNTKFGYRENQSVGNSVTNNTQINVQGSMNLVNTKNRQELLEFIRDGIAENNIIDAEVLSIADDRPRKQD